MSVSQRPVVGRYIQNQEARHRRRSFEVEFIELLFRHGSEYDPKYVFESDHVG